MLTVPTETGHRALLRPPPGHTRRGLGLRELNKLPQIIILLYFILSYYHIILLYYYSSFPRRRLIESFLIYSLSSWLVLVALGLALGCLGLISAPTWLPSTCPWAPWGLHGVSFGYLGAPSGVPSGSLGLPWGPSGCPRQFSQICRKLDAQFRANVSICTRLRIESSLPELACCARGAYGARVNGSQSAAQTPPGHTRQGLGLRELHKSLELLIHYFISKL